ncbi:MAG: MFS transporter [Gammaproteobacteria bacterium]|jgi:MFS family permease|nr:MFS transporter [Gammaproteobacteria bacterium]
MATEEGAARAEEAADPAQESAAFTKGYRYYVLGILTVAYVFNFIDRQILVILQESIKVDLDLSDAQLGLLSGFAFAVFYVTVGIPIARWADRGTRRTIISLAIGVWSAMTAVCGIVQNYWQLLGARIGVGVGEAGGSPPAHSMISDMFAPHERATALSIYNLGIPFGIFVGFLAGGWINEYLGWRYAFFAVGIPGLIFAFIVRATVREPPRGMSEGIERVADAPPVFEVIRILWSRRSFRHMSIAAGLHAFVGYGVGQFMASFLIRVHDLNSGEAANWLAPVSAIGGGLGTFFGGYLCDKYGADDARWYVWLPAAAIVISLPFALFTYLYPWHVPAMVVYMIPVALGSMYLGPMLSMTHGMVSLRMRAVASSILFFVLNLIGLGMGPFLTGVVSDVIGRQVGDIGTGLRYALCVVALVNLWCAAHYFYAAKYIRHDLARAPK